MEGDGVTTEKSEQLANSEPILPAEVVSELENAGITNPELIREIIIGQELKEKGDIIYLTKEALMAAGMKGVPLEKALVKLGIKNAPGAQPQPSQAANPMITLDILPKPPSDESLLTALKAGGVVEVDESTIISAIRASLAAEFDLFGIPGKLLVLMEAFAKRSQRPVDKKYWEIRKLVLSRSYAEIFEGLGIDGRFVTDAKKAELFERINQYLWPPLITFNQQLTVWQRQNLEFEMPVAMQAFMGQGATVTGVPPDTGPLMDASEELARQLNMIFADIMVPVTGAVALEAIRIKRVLENKDLPVLTGAANRDEMLRMLEATVPATSPRMEENITRLVLAILHLKDQPTGREMTEYLKAMFMVASQIPWDDIKEKTTKRVTGIGRKSNESGNKLL